jgi:steroid 5-alpha reductase family enzyme
MFAMSSSAFRSPAGLWTILGPISMIILFTGISIPLMEKRNLERRPGYEEYIKKVPVLIPGLKSKRK